MGDGTRIERDCVLREGEVRRSNCWWGTLRTDDPRLTSRNGTDADPRISASESGIVEVVRRAVEEARLWDTSVATTIVMTSASHGKPELVKVLREIKAWMW